MALTLSVVVGIALLLPGLFSLLFWNVRARRHSASRPDLPITAVSVLAIAVAGSLVAHLLTWGFFEAIRTLALGVGEGLPASIGKHLYPAAPNPIEIMVRLAQQSREATAPPSWHLAFAGVTVLIEILLVSVLLADDGFDLATNGLDLGNQGWVYTHVVRPAQNGYRPVAYVLTTLQKDGLGIGYRGVVADIRQSDRGETLAVSLSEPARFLFELKAGKEDGGYGRPAIEPSFVRYPEEEVGDVIALDARVIQNIAVSNPQADRLRRLGRLEAERLEEERRQANHA